MFEQISKDMKGLISKLIIVGIIILMCSYLGLGKKVLKVLLTSVGMGTLIEISDDKDEKKIENPKPNQKIDEVKESYINSLIYKEDLLIVDEYRINWMTIFDTSEEKIIQLEGMIDDIKKYLKYDCKYSDEDINKYFGSSNIDKSEDGEKLFFVLNEGVNMPLSELMDLYSEIKNIMSIINRNSKNIFEDVSTKEEPRLYGNNEKIEEKIIEIRKEYNIGDTNIAKHTAYSLAKFILENQDMNIYHKYLKDNEDLFIEHLNVIYKSNNSGDSKYALNIDILNDNDIYIKDIVLESKYSTGITVRENIKNELYKLGMKYENIIYDVENVDNNLYVFKLYTKVEDGKYQDLGIYEYNSVANCIETIYQIGYGTVNEDLKNKYSK